MPGSPDHSPMNDSASPLSDGASPMSDASPMDDDSPPVREKESGMEAESPKSGVSLRNTSLGQASPRYMTPGRSFEARTSGVSARFRNDFGADNLPLLSDLLSRYEPTCLLSEDEKKSVERHSKLLTFEPGTLLKEVGTEVVDLYVIQSGNVQLKLGQKDSASKGGQLDIEFLSRGDLIFERELMPILGSSSKAKYQSSHTVAALERTKVWSISIKKLRDSIAAARSRSLHEMATCLRSSSIFSSLSWEHACAIAKNADVMILHESQISGDPAKLDQCWIVWFGCVVAVDSQNERTEQYYPGDIFTLEDLGGNVHSGAIDVKITARNPPTVLFSITSNLVNTVTKHTLRQIAEKSAEAATLLNMESVSVVAGDKKKKKTALGGVISHSAKLLGIKKGASSSKSAVGVPTSPAKSLRRQGTTRSLDEISSDEDKDD